MAASRYFLLSNSEAMLMHRVLFAFAPHLLIFLPTSAAAQPATEPKTSANNAAYLEVGGSAFFYSLNYERRVGEPVALRVGFSYISSSNKEPSGATQVHRYYLAPLTASYLPFGGDHHLELGAGILAGYVTSKEPIADTAPRALVRSSTNGPGAALTVVVGYRYQPREGGLLFRAGLTPIFSFQEGVLPWAGLSLGAVF